MRDIRQIIHENVFRSVKNFIRESQENGENYTHYAVNKETNLIVNGWDYSDEDPEDLRQFKNDYFIVDLKDYGFNPKAYKIISAKTAAMRGIGEWSNTGVFPLSEENRMKKEGVNFYELAHEQHPEWFLDTNESKKRVNEAVALKKGDTFKLPVGEVMGRKILSKKYGVSPDDFKYDGVRFVYDPKKRPPKPKLSKPKDMSEEEYLKQIVLPNNPKLKDSMEEIPNEQWKPVVNQGRYFGGNVVYSKSYEVSNYGRLRIIDFADALNSRISDGYDAPTRGARQFHLNFTDKNGNVMNTTPPVSSIVADAWLGAKDPSKWKVVHLDGNYHNNMVSNLKWVPRSAKYQEENEE